jgi:hypothetical protein
MVGATACERAQVPDSGIQIQKTDSVSSWLPSSASAREDSLAKRYLGLLDSPSQMTPSERDAFRAANRGLQTQPSLMMRQHPSGEKYREMAELYRLDGTARYLAVGFAVDRDSGAVVEGDVAYYVLDLVSNPPQFSAPYRLGTADDNLLRLEALTDVDGDGLADVLYCRFPDSTDLERDSLPVTGMLVGVGHRGGQWYHLADAGLPRIECPG